MREGGVGRDPPSRGALEEALLEQIGLVDVLDRVRLLSHRDRQRAEADRAAAELGADRAQDLAVQPVEPGRVHLEHVEGVGGHARVYMACPAHLGEVADPLQQAVRHPGRAARARGDRPGARLVDLHLEDARRAKHDPGELGRLVQLQPVGDAEAVRSGVVSRPVRVVAPISVKAGRSSETTAAPAPCPTVIGSFRSSIAG